MIMEENIEKSKLIKEALKIVDELGKLDPDEQEDSEKEILVMLIYKAGKLRKNKHWKL